MTPPPSAEASSNVLAISTAKDTSGADYFVGPSGHALYIFDHDSAGKSTCNGDCATTWPPLTIATGQTVIGAGIAKPFQTIKRDDGSTQVAYNNLPLYYFSGDTGPTDTNGDGIGSVWHLARP